MTWCDYRDSYMNFVGLLRFFRNSCSITGFFKEFVRLHCLAYDNAVHIQFLSDLVRLQGLIYDNAIHIRFLYKIIRLQEFLYDFLYSDEIFKWHGAITGIYIWILYVYRYSFRNFCSITGIFIWLCTITGIHLWPCAIIRIHLWPCEITGIHLWPCAITRIHLWPCEITGIHIWPFVFLPRFSIETVPLQGFIYDILYYCRDILWTCMITGLHTYIFVLLPRILNDLEWLQGFLFDLLHFCQDFKMKLYNYRDANMTFVRLLGFSLKLLFDYRVFCLTLCDYRD